MGKLINFEIIDLVGKHDLTKISAANGRSALKQFMRQHMMNSGIYEFIKDGENWHMVSSYGSDFVAIRKQEV